MRHLKLTIMYDGTAFGGWQLQPNARTVQEVLETAIKSITQEAKVRCTASGRTDSGVHALGQVVAFFTMVVAACEVVVGLAIIMTIYRTRRSANVDDAHLLRH